MMILINPVCSASIDSPYLGSETPNLVPGRQTGRQVQSTESPQAEGVDKTRERWLYVHRLCLEAAEP